MCPPPCLQRPPSTPSTRPHSNGPSPIGPAQLHISSPIHSAFVTTLIAPTLGHALCAAVGIPFVELREFDLQPSVLTMIPTKLIRTFRLLPVKLSGNALTVAMVNPRDGAALAELKRTLQTVEISVVAIGLEDFSSALVRLKLLDDVRPAKAGRAGTDPNTLQFETVAEQERDALRMRVRALEATAAATAPPEPSNGPKMQESV